MKKSLYVKRVRALRMIIINFQKAEFKNKIPPVRSFGVASVFADPPSLSFLRQGYEGTSYGGQAKLNARYDIRATRSNH